MLYLCCLVMRLFNPVSCVEKLYDAADKIVENIDNSIIDKIRSRKVKKIITMKLNGILIDRRRKIGILINKIKD